MPLGLVIAIGASAGGIQALMQLVSGLPASTQAAILVTVHIGQRGSVLPVLLSRAGVLRAIYPVHGAPLQPNMIHVAPPDHHLLLASDGTIQLDRGPLVHRTRPAVDPMFRSVARAFGPRAVGVVLSGTLDDGTAGLLEIKQHGGWAVVQAPEDAKFPGMPRSALRHVAVDQVAPAAEMGALLASLPSLPLVSRPAAPASLRKAMEMPSDLTCSASGDSTERPVALTCPLCGGAVRQKQTGHFVEYGCHIGHQFSAASFLDAQMAVLDQNSGVLLRTLNERAELCRRMAESAKQAGDQDSVERWMAAVREAEERAEEVRRALARDWLQPDQSEVEGNVS
jgi:two-component system chemotaxis response regulator CheB